MHTTVTTILEMKNAANVHCMDLYVTVMNVMITLRQARRKRRPKMDDLVIALVVLGLLCIILGLSGMIIDKNENKRRFKDGRD